MTVSCYDAPSVDRSGDPSRSSCQRFPFAHLLYRMNWPKQRPGDVSRRLPARTDNNSPCQPSASTLTACFFKADASLTKAKLLCES